MAVCCLPHISPCQLAVPWESVGILKFTELMSPRVRLSARQGFPRGGCLWGVLGATSGPEFMMPCGPATAIDAGRSEPVGAGPVDPGQGPTLPKARSGSAAKLLLWLNCVSPKETRKP